MAPSSHLLNHPHLLLLLLCFLPLPAAAATSSSYSFPVFDTKSTTDGVVVTTDTAMLAPATFLFDTSFTLDVGGPGSSVSHAVSVAFVVLLDSFPPLNGNKHGPRPTEADTSAVPNATNGVAAVEVGTVIPYGPRIGTPGIGLNVTVTPNRSSGAGQLAVRIEYAAAAHRLSVYVDDADAGGDPRLNSKPALLDAPLDLADRLPTQDALVGFFAATVRDVVVGVSGWDLTVDMLLEDEGDGQRHPSASSSTRLVILLAVVGSVAVVVAVSVMVYLAVSRRRALDKELQKCYAAHFARTRL